MVFSLLPEYLINMLGGSIIGIAIWGQFFIAKGIGKITRSDSLKKKTTAYIFKVVSMIVSYVALIFVIRYIRMTTVVTLPSVALLITGFLATVLFCSHRFKN